MNAVATTNSDVSYQDFIDAEHARVEQRSLLAVIRHEVECACSQVGEEAKRAYPAFEQILDCRLAIQAGCAPHMARLHEQEANLSKAEQASADAWAAYERARGIGSNPNGFAAFFVAVAQVAEQRVEAKKAAAEAKKQASLSIVGRATFKATGAVLFGVEDRRGKEPVTMHLTLVAGRVTWCVNATTGEKCSGRRWSGHCCHETRVMSYEVARVVAEQVAELLPEMAESDDVEAHIEDSIESGELTDPWLDPCYNPFQGMSEDQKRAARYWMFESAAA